MALARHHQVTWNFVFLCYLGCIFVPADFVRAANARTIEAFEESARDYALDNGRFPRR